MHPNGLLRRRSRTDVSADGLFERYNDVGVVLLRIKLTVP
jgi:hypothetical protein